MKTDYISQYKQTDLLESAAISNNMACGLEAGKTTGRLTREETIRVMPGRDGDLIKKGQVSMWAGKERSCLNSHGIGLFVAGPADVWKAQPRKGFGA